jgi:hypothetical protein
VAEWAAQLDAGRGGGSWEPAGGVLGTSRDAEVVRRRRKRPSGFCARGERGGRSAPGSRIARDERRREASSERGRRAREGRAAAPHSTMPNLLRVADAGLVRDRTQQRPDSFRALDGHNKYLGAVGHVQSTSSDQGECWFAVMERDRRRLRGGAGLPGRRPLPEAVYSSR